MFDMKTLTLQSFTCRDCCVIHLVTWLLVSRDDVWCDIWCDIWCDVHMSPSDCVVFNCFKCGRYSSDIEKSHLYVCFLLSAHFVGRKWFFTLPRSCHYSLRQSTLGCREVSGQSTLGCHYLLKTIYLRLSVSIKTIYPQFQFSRHYNQLSVQCGYNNTYYTYYLCCDELATYVSPELECI